MKSDGVTLRPTRFPHVFYGYVAVGCWRVFTRDGDDDKPRPFGPAYPLASELLQALEKFCTDYVDQTRKIRLDIR